MNRDQQKEYLSKNLQMLRKTSYLPIDEFCENLGISPASYNRYITKLNFPHAETIRMICNFFNLSRDQLLNELIPEDYIITNPHIYFLHHAKEDIDKQLIEFIQHHYIDNFDKVIQAFKELELKIEIMPDEIDFDFESKELPLKEHHEQEVILANYSKFYTADTFISLVTKHQPNYYGSFADKKPIALTDRINKYIDYYKPIYVAKCKLIYKLQHEEFNLKCPNFHIRLCRFKPISSNDTDMDIYETVKTFDFKSFLRYCNNYKKAILKVFDVKD